MTLEKLDEIEKNYRKVFDDELQKIFEMYPSAKELYEDNGVVIEEKPKKKFHFFFKRKKKEEIIKLNDISKK